MPPEDFVRADAPDDDIPFYEPARVMLFTPRVTPRSHVLTQTMRNGSGRLNMDDLDIEIPDFVIYAAR